MLPDSIGVTGCADLRDQGWVMQLFSCNNYPNQMWYFDKLQN